MDQADTPLCYIILVMLEPFDGNRVDESPVSLRIRTPRQHRVEKSPAAPPEIGERGERVEVY